MDTENERNWELLTCLAYSYLTFAGLTDGDLAEEETEVILDCIREYSPDASDDEITEACATAHRWINDDLKTGKASHNAAGLAHWLNENPFRDNEQRKKAFLNDLVRISMADGVFLENEKAMIKVFSDVFGLEGYPLIQVLPDEA